MKAHPALGADLCKGLRTLDKVVPLIRNHDEKLDGSGYPDGLKGDEISLGVRIISVVERGLHAGWSEQSERRGADPA